MAKVYIIDFEDSFTYNIFAEITLLGIAAAVYHQSEIKKILH